MQCPWRACFQGFALFRSSRTTICICLLINICHNRFYRPQRSCEGYVYTGVCLSTGGEYLVRYPPRTSYPPGPGTPTPQHQVHPPDQVHPPRPSTPLQARYLPGPGTPPRTRYTPQDQVHTPPGLGTPPRVHPPGPGTPPDQVHPPGPGTPPGIRPLLRTVRILLECILVLGINLPD